MWWQKNDFECGIFVLSEADISVSLPQLQNSLMCLVMLMLPHGESVAWLHWLGFLCPSDPGIERFYLNVLPAMYVSDFSHICIKYLMIH